MMDDVKILLFNLKSAMNNQKEAEGEEHSGEHGMQAL